MLYYVYLHYNTNFIAMFMVDENLPSYNKSGCQMGAETIVKNEQWK